MNKKPKPSINKIAKAYKRLGKLGLIELTDIGSRVTDLGNDVHYAFMMLESNESHPK